MTLGENVQEIRHGVKILMEKLACKQLHRQPSRRQTVSKAGLREVGKVVDTTSCPLAGCGNNGVWLSNRRISFTVGYRSQQLHISLPILRSW